MLRFLPKPSNVHPFRSSVLPAVLAREEHGSVVRKSSAAHAKGTTRPRACHSRHQSLSLALVTIFASSLRSPLFDPGMASRSTAALARRSWLAAAAARPRGTKAREWRPFSIMVLPQTLGDPRGRETSSASVMRLCVQAQWCTIFSHLPEMFLLRSEKSSISMGYGLSSAHSKRDTVNLDGTCAQLRAPVHWSCRAGRPCPLYSGAKHVQTTLYCVSVRGVP